MEVGAEAFLGGGVGWLEEEDGLGGEEEGGGVEELWREEGRVSLVGGEEMEWREGEL